MPSDPFQRGLALVALGIAAIFVLAGLTIAVLALLIFVLYRSFSSQEYQTPERRRQMFEWTARTELLAAAPIAVGVAIGALMLLPLDSPTLRHDEPIVKLALGLAIAVAAPLLVYRRLVKRGTGQDMLRLWIRGTAKGEIWAALYISIGLMQFVPSDAPMWWLLLLVLIISLPALLVTLFQDALRADALWAGVMAGNHSATRTGAVPRTSRQPSRVKSVVTRRPFRRGQKKGAA